MLKDQIISLFILFKNLKSGGLLIVEEIDFPEKKEDKLTNNKNGNVILVNSTAKSNLILFSMKPGAIR